MPKRLLLANATVASCTKKNHKFVRVAFLHTHYAHPLSQTIHDLMNSYVKSFSHFFVLKFLFASVISSLSLLYAVLFKTEFRVNFLCSLCGICVLEISCAHSRTPFKKLMWSMIHLPTLKLNNYTWN